MLLFFFSPFTKRAVPIHSFFFLIFLLASFWNPSKV